MTIKQILTLRNIMIILCIFMFVLLGEKIFLIADKIKAVQAGDRLYAAGDLIAAEDQFRQAAANLSIHYKEESIASRLTELAPITTIRSSLSTLVLSARAQAATKDFPGFMKSYDTLLTLKTTYMKPGGPYEAYYRQLSAASGISDQFTAYFKQFKQQFLAELAQSQTSSDTNEDSFKWNLLLIPDAYYGSADSKAEELASKFMAHDTAKLKTLAGAGSFAPMLDSALTLINNYTSHNYKAPWVKEQTESSGKIFLNKDMDSDSITAFAGHAVAYRKFASSAGFTSSKVLTLIDKNTTKLVKNAGKLAKAGQYAASIQLYGELAPLQDTAPEVAATRLAWNIAEPVRLLPGGEEQGKYTNIISTHGRYGAKVVVAGTDSSGRLYYAAMNNDNSVVTLTGDILPGFENLHSLIFDNRFMSSSEVPVALAEAGRADGRNIFTAYELQSQGISVLFSLTGASYELQPDDSIIVTNADLGDGVDDQTALYRKLDGAYQFVEIVQEYPVIITSDLEYHPFENVSLNCEIGVDLNGKWVAYSDGSYLSLQGDVGSVTGSAVISGQFQNGYEFIMTDIGEQYVPVFVVDKVGSLSTISP